MWFRSNAARRFDVDMPVDNPSVSAQVRGHEEPRFPQAIHRLVEEEWLWANESEAEIDRETLLGELYAERFGLPQRRPERT